MRDFFFVAAVFLVSSVNRADTIYGQFRTKLTKPVTKELIAQAHEAALRQLRVPLLEWINEHSDIPWDTTNAIYRHHLTSLVGACAERAAVKSEIENHLWKYTIAVTKEMRHAAVVAHNAKHDSLALKNWSQACDLAQTNDYPELLRACVAAIFHAMGHVGAPLTTVGDPAQTPILDSARLLLNRIISRLTIQYSHMIIEGKAGYKPISAPEASIVVDSTPLPRFPLEAALPREEKVALWQTDGQGRFYLSQLSIPYVANGTFLYVRPLFSGFVSEAPSIGAKDLGLVLTSAQQPTFIYKLAPARYSLRYAVQAVSKLDIPADFSGTQFIHKFLKDSCFIVPQQGTEPVDLRFDIVAQVSSYTNDQTFSMNLKTEARIVIEPLRGQGSMLERQMLIHERSYDVDKEVSTGLFYWEAAGKLTAAIKKLLRELAFSSP